MSDAPLPFGAFVAFSHRSYVLYWAERFLATFATQIVSVAIGWHVYDITRDPLDLGFVGLAQFLPALVLVLVTGSVADRYDRKTIIILCLAGEFAMTALLLALVLSGTQLVWPIFVLLVGFGIFRAFFGPASQAMLPNLVPPEHLPNAIAMNSSAWQIATIVGPVAGGLLYGVNANLALIVAAFLFGVAALLIALIPRPPQRAADERPSFETVVAGFRYVWNQKLVLGAISLDLFAVLLGGAVALMPAFARDILEVGPWGLGMLRAAPGIGAVAMAVILTYRPVSNHAGLIMFAAVAVFGAFTIIFGVSTLAWLSILALVVMGAADMVSVYVREVLIQIATPDEVRGRVNAVNMVFVGASNELGEFRAGVVAAWIGVVVATVVGGFGTLLVAGLWSVLFPSLRRAKRLDRLD